MPSLPHRPALAPRDGISSFASVQSSDSYYSNEEIAILHDVVSAAQGNLNLLPEGERLATNALFQAYDTVLPHYGIDPEEDHHISRLVFRIGGERGDGSLLDKLRAVLSRMDIELEFDSRSECSKALSEQGDEPSHGATFQASKTSSLGQESTSTGNASDHIQPTELARYKSSSPLPQADQFSQATSPSRLTEAFLPLDLVEFDPLRQHPDPLWRTSSPSTAEATEQSRKSPQSGVESNGRGASDTTVHQVDTAPLRSEKNAQALSPPAIRSKPVRTVNWLLPTVTATKSLQNGDEPAPAAEDKKQQQKAQASPVETLPQINIEDHGQDVVTSKQQDSPQPAEHSSDDGGRGHEQGSLTDEQQKQQPPQAYTHPNGNFDGDKQDLSDKEQSGGDLEAEARYALMERRAVKAARYLQILRGTSHWKAYAIEKLERTAVARRHILRMRHFDPWELVAAESKFKGRRIFTLCLTTLWLGRADEYVTSNRLAVLNAHQHLRQNILASWFRSCPSYTESFHPRFLTIYIQKWQSFCSASQALQAHVAHLSNTLVTSRVCQSWQRQAWNIDRGIASFRRFSVIDDSLNQWHLDMRVEVFRAKMGIRLMRRALSGWGFACPAPPSHSSAGVRSDKRQTDIHVNQYLFRPARGTPSIMAISHRMTEIKILDNWHRQVTTLAATIAHTRRFAMHQKTRKVLESWHINMHHKLSLSMWAQRGLFFVSITEALKTWRSMAAWRSSTRKSYARCRQHVKATFTKGYLNRWKTAAHVHEGIGREASGHSSILQRDRLILMLNAWRDESRTNWGAFKLVTATWVEIWHDTSQEHAGIQGLAEEAWDETLKSRYWGQWQSTLLQLKSREYIASDVRESNKKKQVRRLLHYWKGDRDLDRSQQSTFLRVSLGNSRRGQSLDTSRNSLQHSRVIHDRPVMSIRGPRVQELGSTIEEEEQDGPGSVGDGDGVMVNTPTRWTGMASSVTRLSSMTPFAPLPTPVERELRKRYNRSMPSVPSGQASRLPFSHAHRINVADSSAADRNYNRSGSVRRGE